MGAWIEINVYPVVVVDTLSLLSWERGLKFLSACFLALSRTVAPLVGAWIEIFKRIIDFIEH